MFFLIPCRLSLLKWHTGAPVMPRPGGQASGEGHKNSHVKLFIPRSAIHMRGHGHYGPHTHTHTHTNMHTHCLAAIPCLMYVPTTKLGFKKLLHQVIQNVPSMFTKMKKTWPQIYQLAERVSLCVTLFSF